MVRGRLSAYRRRIRTEFDTVFAGAHTPHEIAASFAFGVFVTTLPTLGTGLLVFVVVAYHFERVSKLALFASVVILNPVAKWGVYAASLWIGIFLLGRPAGVTLTAVSLTAGPEVAIRLLVGNVILAVVFAVVGYLAVHRLVREYRQRELDLLELVSKQAGD